ncbi:MAG: Fe-S cluster assembly protein NifU [Deltaproteobacteria bacterium]|nr:Fe-S cluster assembly protein NifU [Deltaproteobacteria bacterium]
MAWDYTDKVKEYYRHPKNVGEVEAPDAVGEVGSIVCGDALRLTLKVDPETKIITDAKFQTFGCGSAIASSSALTEMILGKSLDDAAQVTNQQIADFLGGLPPEKMHCSVMGMDALEAAIADYRGEEHKHTDEDEGKIVCHCFGITDKYIERAIRDNKLTSVEDVTNYTKAGGGCGSCHDEIESILFRVRSEQAKEAKEHGETPRKKKRMSTLQKIKLIEETIDQEIRPALQQDGGDLDLIDVEGNEVIVAFRGFCSGCVASHLTLEGIQMKLREVVLPDLVVVEDRDEQL